MINIPINDYETILEPFCDGGESYTGHFKYSPLTAYTIKPEGSANQIWDSVTVSTAAGSCSKMERVCNVNTEDYDTMRVFWVAEAGITMRLYCNGSEVINTRGTGKLDYADGHFAEKKLSSLRFEFENSSDTLLSAGMMYLGMRSESRLKTAAAFPFTDEWEGCFEAEPDYELFSEVMLSREELAQMRPRLTEHPYSEIFQTFREIANDAMTKPPELKIARSAHDRFRMPNNFAEPMTALAFIGQAENNPEMLRMACRYALSLACCTCWSFDKVEELPGITWFHRSFTPADCCVAITAVLCFAGKLLTWHGRNILLQALIMKGLPRIEADYMTMDYIYHINQGMVFSTGYICALSLLAETYPRYNRRIDEIEKTVDDMFCETINPDGSMNEGAIYWEYSMSQYFSSCYMLARRKGLSIAEYLKDKLYKTSEFALFMLNEKGIIIPVNDSRPDPYTTHVCSVFSQVTGDLRWNYLCRKGRVERNIFAFLLPKPENMSEPFYPQKFQTFYDMGLVSYCNDGVHFMGIAGPSNSTHCHADKGSFVLYKNGNPIFLDVSGGAYDTAVHKIVKYSSAHNICVPVADGKVSEQYIRDGITAKILTAELSGNGFIWSTDTTDVWDRTLVKRSIRTVSIDENGELTILDEFEFSRPASISFRFNMYDRKNAEITPIDWVPVREACTPLVCDSAGRQIYRFELCTGQELNFRLTTKITV